jgi:hypothetical protein
MITKAVITAPPGTPGRDDHEIWARAQYSRAADSKVA